MTLKSIVLAALTPIALSTGYAQGCVAVRSTCGASGSTGSGSILMKGEFLVGTNQRYFKSYKHFRGTHEETERVENGTEVINHSYFAELTLNYGITNRMYGFLNLPFAYHLRSSMYEHGGNPPAGLGDRHETSSYGLADIRVGSAFWLWKPETHPKFNYSIGLGFKLPTGNYNYQDEFYNQGSNKDSIKTMVVDQSIQLGDGGLGIGLEFQGYQFLTEKLFMSTYLYYMSNPKEHNRILTRTGTQYFSCPDQYAVRWGLSYILPVEGLVFNGGVRWEGVPSDDLIGGSAGFRRPGYAISVDPGITYAHNKLTLTLGVPVAVERNRVQSYQDKVDTETTGVFKQGDAAFADYVINFGLTYKLNSKNPVHVTMPE